MTSRKRKHVENTAERTDLVEGELVALKCTKYNERPQIAQILTIPEIVTIGRYIPTS